MGTFLTRTNGDIIKVVQHRINQNGVSDRHSYDGTDPFEEARLDAPSYARRESILKLYAMVVRPQSVAISGTSMPESVR